MKTTVISPAWISFSRDFLQTALKADLEEATVGDLVRFASILEAALFQVSLFRSWPTTDQSSPSCQALSRVLNTELNAQSAKQLQLTLETRAREIADTLDAIFMAEDEDEDDAEEESA